MKNKIVGILVVTLLIATTLPVVGTYNIDTTGIENNDNHPPETPTIDGPASVKAGVDYEYRIVTSDPEDHDFYFYIDMGDGTIYHWIGACHSGRTLVTLKRWSGEGPYEIKVKAKDDPNGDGDLSDGLESDWATLEISMPKSKAINTPFLRFLEQHPYLFPLLRQLLGLQ